MKKIIKEDLPIERYTLPRDEAIKFMKEKNEDYKVELIEELTEGEEISFYKQGEFTDLCAGPHLMSTGKVKAIKYFLLQVLIGEAMSTIKCYKDFMEYHILKLAS